MAVSRAVSQGRSGQTQAAEDPRVIQRSEMEKSFARKGMPSPDL